MSSLLAGARAAGRRLMPGGAVQASVAPMSEAALPQTQLVPRSPMGVRHLALLMVGPAVVIAAVVTLRSEHLAQPGFRAAYSVFTIAAPVLIGIAWWARRAQSLIGPLLVVLGYVTLVMSWQASDVPVLYVLGIGAEPVLAFLTLFVALSFPTGRLSTSVDRVSMGAWAATAAIGWIGAILFVSDLGPASPLSACIAACPPNPLAIGALSPDGLRLGWALLAIAAILVIAQATLALTGRAWSASPAQRRELVPVFLATAFYLMAFVLFHGARFIEPSPALIDASETFMVVARLAFPLGPLVALLATDYFAVSASRRLAAGLTAPTSLNDVETRLSDAVRDPDLRLGIWDVRQHRYTGSDGAPLGRRSASVTQMWIAVRDNGDRLAALVTDAGFGATPRLTDALTTATLIEVRGLIAAQQAEALRARAVEATDAERRRIARDLHDSAQQRLVALRVQLMLATERTDALDRNRAIAQRLAGELDLTIEELRQLARRFLTPAALGNGIVPAIRALADNWPVRVTVHVRGLTRHPADVELAVYNCCLEALQNVADHAGSSATVEVRLVQRRAGVHFVVTDNGVGFDPAVTERGAGLTRLVDRAVLAGGCASIRTAPGRGVRVSGLIPTPAIVHAT